MSIRKTILFVDHDEQLTGSTVSLEYLLKYFINKGYEVIVLSPKKGNAAEYLNKYDIRIEPLQGNFFIHTHFTNSHSIFRPKGFYIFFLFWIRMLKGAMYFFWILKKIKPDIVYINEHALFQFAIASKILKIPTFTHLRSTLLKGTFGLRKRIISYLLKRLNNTVFAITSEEAIQVNKYGGDTANLLIINEFLDGNNFAPILNREHKKAKYGIPFDKKIILMIGGYEQIKGTIETLHAFKLLIDKKENVFLVIMGTVNRRNKLCRRYTDECFDFIKINKLNEHVLTLPYNQNPTEIISLCDILLSPSTKSHFSRPIIEAWAQNKGIVSSNTPHAQYFVDDMSDGVLFKIGDAKDLAKKIESLLYDNELYNRICKNGYKKAYSLFYADINCEKIFHICDSANAKN